MTTKVKNNLRVYFLSTEGYEIRREIYEGREHIVVPVVMMVEGVHSGSHGPIFHSIDELGRIPNSWDGIPVTINHPQIDGLNVSANSPGVLRDWGVGRIFGTHVKNDGLHAEAWIDVQKITAISPDALEHILKKNPLDVSVGIFSEEIPEQGEWHGERYAAFARNYRPDHLALLPGGTGACSWADGCGIRNNEKGGNSNVNVNEELVINALSYNGTESTPWRGPTLSDFGMSGNWESLSATDRAKVASHFLIGSANAQSYGDLKLPVVNPRTGKLNENALRAVISGRGAQVGGVSAEQRAAARRRAYRLLNSEFNAGLQIPQNLSFFTFTKGGEDGEEFEVTLSVQQVGYRAIMESIQQKLDSMDTNDKMHFLREVFDTNVIYEVKNRNGADELYRQDYRVNNDDSVELTGDATKVQKKVTYVTANNSEKEFIRTKFNNNSKTGTEMSCTPCIKKKVDGLIANEATHWSEDDREFLEGLEESQLDKFSPIEKKDPTPPANHSEQPEITRDKVMEVLSKKPMSDDEYMKFLSPQAREQHKIGLRLHKEQRDSMVQGIIDNTEEGVWPKEDLESMDFDVLERLHKSVVKEEESGSSTYLAANTRTPTRTPKVVPMARPGHTFEKKQA